MAAVSAQPSGDPDNGPQVHRGDRAVTQGGRSDSGYLTHCMKWGVGLGDGSRGTSPYPIPYSPLVARGRRTRYSSSFGALESGELADLPQYHARAR